MTYTVFIYSIGSSMPAIRYLNNHTGTIVTPCSSGKFGYISVLLHNGKTKPVLWLGFICKAGTLAMPEGSPAKLDALEVTAGDGDSGSEWVRLEDNQFVLGWRVLHHSAGLSKWGVYAVIDSNYCPVIVTNKVSPKPTKRAGTVHFLGTTDKRTQKSEGNNRA